MRSAGHENDREVWPALFNLPRKLSPIHAGHLEIGQHDVEPVIVQLPQCFSAAGHR